MPHNPITVLGIDPGTQRVGYGVVKKDGGALVLLDAGLLRIAKREQPDFLLEIKAQLDLLIRKFKPNALSLEKLYFSKNQKTAMAVAQARGVMLLSALEAGLSIQEYGPNEVKSSIAGYGLADKKAVGKMVGLLLKRPDLRLIDDAMDAIALAILGAWNTERIKRYPQPPRGLDKDAP